MLKLTLLLVVGAGVVSADPPPYVQSLQLYSHIKKYLYDFLSPEYSDVHDPEVRRHLSFGVLTGVTGGLVLAAENSSFYEPLLVLDKWFPYAWRNYQEICQRTRTLLFDTTRKIRPVVDLINSQCAKDADVDCNVLVDEKVTKNPLVYRSVAELLIQIGKASELLGRLDSKIDAVTKNNSEIPYLIDNVNTRQIRILISELQKAHTKLAYV